jgi:pimeloyl-ACP methyl ester carboxylesterase
VIFTVDGHPAYWYTAARAFNAALPTVVFIHGAQNDHSVWALQSRYIAHHGANVLAVDLPGHGRSGGPALASVEVMATWLLALLDAAGIEQATLVGHSMGSLIALEATHQAPSHVRALAMLGTTYPMQVSPALLTTARDDEPAAIDMVAIWSHSTLPAQRVSAVPGTATVMGARRLMQRMSTRNPHQLFHTDFAACNAYANGEVAAASVTCPALFIFGAQDMMTPPRSTKRLTAAIAHAKVVHVNAGHALMQEQPDAVLDALIAFAAPRRAAS